MEGIVKTTSLPEGDYAAAVAADANSTAVMYFTDSKYAIQP
jgi:hypothetical protein